MIPASIRNRNPGAMYPGPSAKKFGSTSFETLRSRDGVHKIATFPTDQHGAAAMFDLLASKYVGMSIEAAIKKWCGGYYASTYIKVLEGKGGVTASDPLTLALVRDPQTAIPLARAMAWQEAGRDYPLDDAGWLEAHGMAFGGATAPEFSPKNDVPSPKPETRRAEAAKTVGTWGGAIGGAGAVIGSWIEGVSSTAKQVAAYVTDLGPIKAVAVEAGANARALTLAAVAAGIVVALGQWAKGRV